MVVGLWRFGIGCDLDVTECDRAVVALEHERPFGGFLAGQPAACGVFDLDVFVNDTAVEFDPLE